MHLNSLQVGTNLFNKRIANAATEVDTHLLPGEFHLWCIEAAVDIVDQAYVDRLHTNSCKFHFLPDFMRYMCK